MPFSSSALMRVDVYKRQLEQCALADEAGAAAGQIALRAVGIGVEQVVCRDDLQHAVAQKLKPFVVLDGRAGLVGVAGVGERRFQQLRVAVYKRQR